LHEIFQNTAHVPDSLTVVGLFFRWDWNTQIAANALHGGCLNLGVTGHRRAVLPVGATPKFVIRPLAVLETTM
jgi:hypothetical protein